MVGKAFAEGVAGSAGQLAQLWVGCFILGLVSIGLSAAGDTTVAVWLANGFAIVFLHRRLASSLPAGIAVVFAGSAAAHLVLQSPAPLALAVAAADAVDVGVTLLLARLWLPDDAMDGDSPEQQAAFFGIASVAAPAMTGSLVVLLMMLVGEWSIGIAFEGWVSANLLGGAIMLPTLMLWPRRREPGRFAPMGAVPAVATGLVGVAACAVALVTIEYPFAATGLVLLVLSVWCSRLETALICAATGLAAIALASAGVVPGLDTGAAAFTGRFVPTLALTISLPVFNAVIVSRAREDRRRTAESELLFRRAMEDSAIGMMIVEMDGTIRKANRAFAEMLGYGIDELVGGNVAEVTHPDDVEVGRIATRDALAAGSLAYSFEKRCVRRDGTPLWVQISGSVICDRKTGGPLYSVSHIENIDARRKAQEAIAEAENRWNFALSSARQGVWDFDARRGLTYYSAMWKEMLGYNEDELGEDPGLWLSMMHPDDRDRIVELDNVQLHGDAYFEAEFRMRHKDGRWIWVLDRGKAIEKDTAGRVVRAIGTHTDITVQKEVQARLAAVAAALEAEKERLRITLNSIGDAVICTDASGMITFMNPAAEELTGHPAALALGRRVDGVYAPRDEETGEAIAPSTADTPVAHNRAFIVRPDGTRSGIRQVVSPIPTGESGSDGSVIVFQDFTDARTLQRQLAHAASHDSLTGLANRSHFMTVTEALLARTRSDRATRHQLLFVDLDHFKTVNDTAGHAAGDALLKEVAATLTRAAGANDVVARLGGDEFALVLRDRPPSRAREEARAIVEAIAALDFRWEGAAFRVGASIGIAPIAPDAATVDEVVADADKCCYAAKTAGRGRVSMLESAGGPVMTEAPLPARSA